MSSIEKAIELSCRYLKIKDLINLRCVSKSYFKLVNEFFNDKYNCRFSNFDLVLNEKRLDMELRPENDSQFNFWTNKWYSSGCNVSKNKRTFHDDLMDFNFTISLNNENELQHSKSSMIDFINSCVKRLTLTFRSSESDSKIVFDHLVKYVGLEKLDVHFSELFNLSNLLRHQNLKTLYINDENIEDGSSLEIDCPNLETLHLNLARPEFKLITTSQLKHLSNLRFGCDSQFDLSGYKSLETLECDRIKDFHFDQLTKLPNLRTFIVKFSTLFNTEKLIQLFDKPEYKPIINKIDIYLTDRKVSSKEDCQKIFNQYRRAINMPLISSFNDF